MDKIDRYRQLIEQLLVQYSQDDPVAEGVATLLMLDTERHHYAWMNIGWDDHLRVYDLIVHFDYPEDDLSMPIVEPEVEELLSDLGYIGEGRYIGTNDRLNPLETKTVTYVEIISIEELSHHLQILKATLIPIEWFYSLNSEGDVTHLQKLPDQVCL